MNAVITEPYPAMRELHCANEYLDNPAALKAAWNRDGYWFFRDVLDKAVIARVRAVYAANLAELGLVDRNDPEVRYRGGDLTKVPDLAKATPLNAQHPERILYEAPTIRAFFNRIFGCDPFWVPITVHRTVPPRADRGLPRLEFIHADAVYNDGLPFMICWVPLDVIDDEVGGLAVVEGVHERPTLHRVEGFKIPPIMQRDVPRDAWRRTTYRPGDLLLMDVRTPHSGITNWSSDRFRFSMDTRVLPSNSKLPLVGSLQQVSASAITIRDAQGDHVLEMDNDSFVRGISGDRMTLAEVPTRYHPGSEVIANADGRRLLNMRPQR